LKNSNAHWTALLLAVLMMAVVGCQKGTKPSEPQSGSSTGGDVESSETFGSVLVLCGSSFRPPMEKLAKMYEDQTGAKVELAFGGSEDHLPRVKVGRHGDLFVTHSPYMQYTRDADALMREVPVGSLAPVLVVKKGNPKGVKSIDDMSRSGLRVVLPNPEYSTCGEMVFGLLKKKGTLDAVLKNVGNAQVRSHAQVASLIDLDQRDAGIMWNGVANNWLDAIEIVPTSYEYDKEIGVSVMGLSYTKNKEAVEAFLDFVDKNGKAVFERFGYKK
jgi:molybdate transport system substrate-binding protein